MANSSDNMGKPREVLDFVRANAIKGDVDSVLATMDRYATEHIFLMNVGPEKGRLLIDELVAIGPQARVLEIGAYCGYSAILIAQQLHAGGHLVSLEMNPESVEVATAMVDFAGLTERVQCIAGDSAQSIATLEGPFDLVFLDHWKERYKPDLQALESRGLLKRGSVVFADNVGPSFNPEEYLRYVRTCGRYENRHLLSTIEYTDRPDAAEVSVYLGA